MKMCKGVIEKYSQNKSCSTVILIAVLIFFSCLSSFAQQKQMLLWFDKPAYQPAEFTYNQKVFNYELC